MLMHSVLVTSILLGFVLLGVMLLGFLLLTSWHHASWLRASWPCASRLYAPTMLLHSIFFFFNLVCILFNQFKLIQILQCFQTLLNLHCPFNSCIFLITQLCLFNCPMYDLCILFVVFLSH